MQAPAESLNLGSLDICGQRILCHGVSPAYHKTFSSTLPTPSQVRKKCLQTLPNALWGQRHSPGRATGLESGCFDLRPDSEAVIPGGRKIQVRPWEWVAALEAARGPER